MKDLFVKLLSELKDGGLISESKSGEYVKSLDKYLEAQKATLSKTASARSNVLLEAQDKQHAAKLQKLVEAIDEDHSGKLERLIESIDVDHTRKLNRLVESLDLDHTRKLKKLVESIDADHCGKLQRFAEAVDADHTRKLERLMEAVDADHAAKLENLVEKIDEDCAKKLKKVVEAVDADHCRKLNQIVDMYEKKLAKAKKSGKIDGEPVNEAKARRLSNMFKTFKEMLMVNTDYTQKEIREAVLDAHNQIQSKDKQLKSALSENSKLNDQMKVISEQMKELECKVLLEKKSYSASPKLKAYLEAYFSDAKSVKEIESKFDEVVSTFNKEESRRKTILAEKTATIQPAKSPVRIEESVDNKTTQPSNVMDMYVQKLEGIRY
jgi:thiol-disulfide isomerase/thioredoxin